MPRQLSLSHPDMRLSKGDKRTHACTILKARLSYLFMWALRMEKPVSVKTLSLGISFSLSLPDSTAASTCSSMLHGRRVFLERCLLPTPNDAACWSKWTNQDFSVVCLHYVGWWWVNRLLLFLHLAKKDNWEMTQNECSIAKLWLFDVLALTILFKPSALGI